MSKLYDICILGAGSAGLSVAAGASQLGLDIVLIEKDKMGGDCLNTGCVPSKSLLAAAHAAHAAKHASQFGVNVDNITIDAQAVHDHVKGVIAEIEPHDSVERFETLGVTVLKGSASFKDKKTVTVNGTDIRARKFVIATGSRASIPPIPGLDASKSLTNENIFDQTQTPKHLLIIGGGPIGLEMAQAHHRLGAKVTVFEAQTLLPRDDQELAGMLKEHLINEGMTIIENAGIENVTHTDSGVTIKHANGETTGSHILVAAGRAPNLDGLNLEAAGVTYHKRGINVDARLRTSNKNIFAAGDIAGGPQFTHVAGDHAGIIIRNVCFRLPAKVSYRALPWVTYTDPELAQIGHTHTSAEKEFGTDNIRVVAWPWGDNDRARAEKTTIGKMKIITNKKGLILGVSALGAHAGEHLAIWSLAITKKLKVGDIAGLMLPYPTVSEISKRAAGAWFKDKLFSDKVRKIVRFLSRLPF